MRSRLQAADVAAFLILTILVGALGTGLGVAAARVRASSPPERGPLRIILRPGADVPSIQRDRVRLKRPLR